MPTRAIRATARQLLRDLYNRKRELDVLIRACERYRDTQLERRSVRIHRLGSIGEQVTESAAWGS